MFKDSSIDNLEIWSLVDKTDPAITDKVNQRGGFTAIDAYSQIKAATKIFGPLGRGWGINATHTTIETAEGVLAACDSSIWYRIGTEVFEGPKVRTLAEISGKRSSGQAFVDTDAAKKALTGGITKSLSYLGFNADVFLGMFDDDEYIKRRQNEVIQEASHELKTQRGEVMIALALCKTLGEVETLTDSDNFKFVRANDSKERLVSLSQHFQAKRKELKDALPETKYADSDSEG